MKEHRPTPGTGAGKACLGFLWTRVLTRRRFLLVGGAGVGALAASYPFFIERHLLFTNRYRIPVEHLPEAFRGFRIAQVTDLHYGALVPLGFLRRVIAGTNAAGADVIVSTGDLVHAGGSGRDQIDAIWPLMCDLSAPCGAFAVLGNHDHWADGVRSRYWLERSGQNLRHRAVCLRRGDARLWLAGTGDLWEDRGDLDGLLAPVPEKDCRVVLAHNPDTADTDFTTRIDLMISGHTHGGQVRIPFVGTPVLPVQNKDYSSGLKTSPRGMPVFISRGIGWSILPIRFNCPPEIAVLELVPA